MKHLLILLLLVSFQLHAQTKKTFEIRGEKVNSEVVANNGNLDISRIDIKNISGSSIFIVWETVSNSFPKNWDCSMCQHGKCQIGIPKGSEFKELKTDKDGFIAIHVMPMKNAGKGQVKFKVFDKAHPNDFEIITFNVEVL